MSDNNDRPAVDPEGLSDEPTVTPAEDVEAPKVPEEPNVAAEKSATPSPRAKGARAAVGVAVTDTKHSCIMGEVAF